MISVEDLKDSLRHQLSALIALYEADPQALEATRHGGEGTRESPPPTEACPDLDLVASATCGDTEGQTTSECERAQDIETCLVAFDAAIRAAERAAHARDDLQRAAHEAMERSATARRVTIGLRQDLQRMLLACGKTFGTPLGEPEDARIAELRVALRRSEADARHADREALTSRRRAELAIAAASAALLAAIQADPMRGNPGFDPGTARAARAVAERAAEQAESSLADAATQTAPAATVIAFERAALPANAKPRE